MTPEARITDPNCAHVANFLDAFRRGDFLDALQELTANNDIDRELIPTIIHDATNHLIACIESQEKADLTPDMRRFAITAMARSQRPRQPFHP